MKIKKIIISGLLAVSLLGCGVWSGCGSGKNATVSPAPDQTVHNAVITEGNGSGLVLTAAQILESDYVNYNVSPQTETAYTITATYKPSYVTNADLVWGVEFVDPNSAWASEKTASDYVTVTANADDCKIAVVSVVKAFGEQIKVVVRSAYNSAISASVLCDYEAAVIGGAITLTHTDGGKNPTSSWNVAMTDFSSANTSFTFSETYTGTRTVDYSLNLGDGTKSPSSGEYGITVYVDHTAFYNAIISGHSLLPARSDIDEISVSNDTGFYVYYEKGDEINLDLIGIDLLTEATRTLIVQSRDYMLGYTTTVPTNWDNGETYAAYCQLMNSTGANVNGRITLEVENCKVDGSYNYKNLVWATGWFDCPIISLTLDQTTLEF